MIVTTYLESEEIALVDDLARQRGITREEMLGELIQAGLSVCEDDAIPPESESRRRAGGA